ncbi:AAA family ATPase [bacterium]|nr:AAA family ATPase [bacterium]
MEKAAREAGFSLSSTPAGVTPVPIREGEPMTQEDYGALPEDEREQLAKKAEEVQHSLGHAMAEIRRLNKTAEERSTEVDKEVVGEKLANQPVLLYQVDETSVQEDRGRAMLLAPGVCEGGDEDCPGTTTMNLLQGNLGPTTGNEVGSIEWPLAAGAIGRVLDKAGKPLGTITPVDLGFEFGIGAQTTQSEEDPLQRQARTVAHVMRWVEEAGNSVLTNRLTLAFGRVTEDVDTSGLDAEASAPLIADALEFLNATDRADIEAAVLAGISRVVTGADAVSGATITCGEKGLKRMTTTWAVGDWLPVSGNLRLEFTYLHKPNPAVDGGWLPYLSRVDIHHLDDGGLSVAFFNYSGDIHKVQVMDMNRRPVRTFSFKFPYEGDFSLQEANRVRATESRHLGTELRTLRSYLITYETYRTLVSGWLNPSAWRELAVFNPDNRGDTS